MELPPDKILSSFTELLHHHCCHFNNKIVIGCRGGVRGLWGDSDNNAGSRAGGWKEVQSWNNEAVRNIGGFSLNIRIM